MKEKGWLIGTTLTLGGGKDTAWAAPGTGTGWPRAAPVLRRTTSLPAGAGAAVVAWSEGAGIERSLKTCAVGEQLHVGDKGGAVERGIERQGEEG